ncbi:MAG TPA: tetratricopeptide repeat protein, partial [Nitrolancea sp.]|nr:tetratricopeptide repeat protein [Nitrolancea sp.]
EGPDAPLWHDRLTRDLDNLRAALDRLLDQRPADASLSVASALFRFWSLGPHRQAGREYLRRALEQAGAESSPVAARTLLTAAHLANQAAAYQDATRLYEQSRIMFESLGDVAGVAMVEIAHGMIELNLGQLETAFTWFTASRAHYEQAGDGAGVADAIGCAGNARSAQGRLIEATALLEAAERRYRELGDDLGLAICRVDQADTLRDQGHPGEAAALLEDSLDALRRYGNWHGLGLALTRLADVVREQGDLARSADLLDEAATLSTQVHSQGLAGWALLQRCRLGLAARDFAAAQQAGEQAIPLLDAGGARWESCEAQETLALVHAAQGEWEGARRLALESLIGFAAMGAQVWTVNVLETVIAILAATRPDPRLAAAGAAADSVRQTLRARRLPTREARFARAMDILRAALGADGFAAAWERGATTSLAEAVAAVNALSESSTGINSGVSNQATIIK